MERCDNCIKEDVCKYTTIIKQFVEASGNSVTKVCQYYYSWSSSESPSSTKHYNEDDL